MAGKTQETLGLKLDGTITPDDLAAATAAFAALLTTLTHEADEERPSVDWVLAEARAGSFGATFRGSSNTVAGRHVISSVRKRYRDLGHDASNGRLNDYSNQVRKNLEQLTAVIDRRVSAVHLQIDNDDISLTQRIPATEPAWKAPESFSQQAYIHGSLRGRLTTLGDAQGIEFGLIDPRTGTITRCYPTEEWADLIRLNWRKWVIVEGKIHREMLSGKALTIQDISDIQPLEDDGPGAYRAARGCAPRKKGEELLPEEAVRRVRDAKRE